MRVTGTTLAICVLLGTTGTATQAAASWSQAESGHAGRSTHAGPGGKGGHVTTRHARTATYTATYHAGGRRGVRHAHTASHRSDRDHLASSNGDADFRASSRGISCVPYARDVTGMAIHGNGREWWDKAAGSYDRGNRPEPGSVMAFRASNGMRMGHVAVVSRVLGARHVLVDHANWGGPGIRKGTVMHNVSVVDVSEDNDWTAVRVQVGYDAGTFGHVYPTYGFIYNRPDDGTAYAAAQPMQRSMRFEQLAEMPLGVTPVSFEPQGTAPLRNSAPQRHR